jgi:hypothetical protein
MMNQLFMMLTIVASLGFLATLTSGAKGDTSVLVLYNEDGE